MHISSSTQICISSIFTSSCKVFLSTHASDKQIHFSISCCLQKREHQDLLAGHGLVTALNALLNSAHPDIHLPALHCLAYLVIGNDKVANLVGSSTYENHSLLHQVRSCSLSICFEFISKTYLKVVRLMDRYRKIEVQFAAAKVIRATNQLSRCLIQILLHDRW